MNDAFAHARLEADALDVADPLAQWRDQFVLPTHLDGTTEIYLVGNSLGPMPKTAVGTVNAELARWATMGVRGHFDESGGVASWAPYHEILTEPMAKIVGAQPNEVVMMNALTVNLHLLMVSFYQPTLDRNKVLIEAGAFPSDHFAVESQIRQRGYDPAKSMVIAAPRPGEHTLRPADLVELIETHGSELALVLLPGVQYYTGQVLDMKALTAAAHSVGAVAGFDLAHAAGNIELELHDWDVDFAAWCSYKYLNGGPGGVAGAFVHERHVNDQSLPKFLGWWGNRKDTRFQMRTDFEPQPTVESWQVSNAPILSMAALRASLDLIEAAGGMAALRAKSLQQIRFLDSLLETHLSGSVENLTPRPVDQRGCQFALRITAAGVAGQAVHHQLEAAGVACDWRHPDVIRVAPAPLFNSYGDICRFVQILAGIVDQPATSI